MSSCADCTGTNGRHADPVADQRHHLLRGQRLRARHPDVRLPGDLPDQHVADKGHNTAGVTLTAKNHYGSINTREHTFIRTSTSGMGAYSPLVDLIGHPHLGQKTRSS